MSPFRAPPPAEEDILKACRIARVDEFAESFPEKYDTIVGERGVKLSGGQRQRISIARAILADPRILILDEATSSLDSESEALIQEGLCYLMRGRTTFVIAHRLSTIRRADQILVVEAGKIIERGTHEVLYALGGRYFDLYTKQHGLQANLFLAPGEGDSIPGEATPGESAQRTGQGATQRVAQGIAEQVLGDNLTAPLDDDTTNGNRAHAKRAQTARNRRDRPRQGFVWAQPQFLDHAPILSTQRRDQLRTAGSTCRADV